MAEYEYRTLTFARDASRGDIRKALADAAEYGHWELTLMAIYWGGARRAEVRRRVVRVERTA
ncbi:DUF5703 family protein [Arsenicicoccus dermatophilus]|uniref:DUF5703 family protein n=1 Tax=Arsenicicoccus dermatophilus TaxID=1076331 RepID=UPI001F4CD051|nr:DUF5703 family protein [Arsenicicoccus dermatophilus]MCH8612518.1 DUF5703 family protein [Arsenicicoccus dermatophilus]